jgi:steroid delta-isomerase-like uncharacterized protein
VVSRYPGPAGIISSGSDRPFQRFDNLLANVVTRPGPDNRRETEQRHHDQERAERAMASSNVETHRAGHEAFNQRNFAAMTKHYADSITWTDHAQGRTFSTPREFQDDFLPGWIASSSDLLITGPRYFDAGQTVACTFTVVGTHNGPLGPFPATGREFALPLCEMWHFDSGGRVVGGDLYYDQVSLLTQLGLMPSRDGQPAG